MSLLYRFALIIITISCQCVAQCDWQAMGADNLKEVAPTGTGYPNIYTQEHHMALDTSGKPWVVLYDLPNRLSVRKYNGFDWEFVGNRKFSFPFAYNCAAITIDEGNTPYVAFADSAYQGRITVMKYSGGTWSVVGTRGVSSPSSAYIDLIVDSSGTPYFLYDDQLVNPGIYCMKFNGSTWDSLGLVGYRSNSGTQVFGVSRSGIPYVAYNDLYVGSGFAVTIKKFTGSAWQTIGVAGFMAGLPGSILFDSLQEPLVTVSYAMDSFTVVKFNGSTWARCVNPSIRNVGPGSTDMSISGDIYAAYNGYSNYLLSVRKYSAGTWSYVGVPNFLPPSAIRAKILVNKNGQVYVAIRTGIADHRVITFNGSTWVTTGLDQNWHTDAGYPQIAVDKSSGKAFISFIHNGSLEDSLKTLTFNGNIWTEVGPYAFPAPIAKIKSSLIVDTTGTPYVAYIDTNDRANVIMFNGANWVRVGNAAFSPPKCSNISLARSDNDSLFVAFIDSAGTGISVMKFDGANWVFKGQRKFTSFTGLPTIFINKLGKPGVAYKNGLTGGVIDLYSFNGNIWVGSVGPNLGGNTDEFSIARCDTSVFGTTYIAYSLTSSGNISVVKSTQSGWVNVGPTIVAKGMLTRNSLCVDSSGVPYLVFADANNNYVVTVIRYNGAGWSTVATPVNDFGNYNGYATMDLDNNNIAYVSYLYGSFYAKKLYADAPITFLSSVLSDTICENGSLVFSSPANGNGLIYQWQASTGGVFSNISNGGMYSGTGTSTLSVSNASMALNNTKYRCLVSSLCASNAISDTATLTVLPKPVPSISVPSQMCAGDTIQLSATGALTYAWMPGNLPGSPMVSPISSIVYTLAATGNNGCVATNTVAVTVNPLPVVSIVPTATAVCAGNLTTLVVNGANTYTWMPGNNNNDTLTVSPGATTIYTVTGTSTTSCVNTATLSIQVNNFPLPTLTLNANPDSICQGNSTSLFVAGASTYSWMPGNLVGSNPFVSPGNSTTYTVTGIDTNNCYAIDTISVFVSPAPNVSIVVTSTFVCNGFSDTLIATGALTYTWSTGAFTDNIIVNPNQVTTYTVSGTNGAGCTAQYVTTIFTNVVTGSSSKYAFCASVTHTLTGTGASTYTWAPGGANGSSVVVSPTVSVIYTVTGTDVNGCLASDTVGLTIYPKPTVTFTAMGFTEPVCTNAGGQLITGASPPGGIYAGPGVANNTFYPSNPGTFNIIYYYSDQNGCTNSASHQVVVQTCVGIEEALYESNISVFPNPSEGVFAVKLPFLKGEYEVYDYLGKVVMHGFITSDDLGLDLTGYSGGLYTLKIVDTQNQLAYKVLLIRL